MKTYLKSLKFVLDNGTVRPDRTSTGTIGVFGMQDRYDLSESFPAVTTKKLAWKAIVSELLWFIEGSGDERRLAEILHGTRDISKRTIWTDNANSEYWKLNAMFEGDLGRVYGVQWRHWKTPEGTEVDQLADLINGIKTDPYGRRHILTAWNPGELKSMALPPCHCFAQFYVSADNKLSCQLYQRSCDMFLGVPFNIASYSLLTHMIAQVCGLGVGDFVHVLGDAHIYLNHIDQVNEQLQREPLPAPQLIINTDVTDINNFTMKDFTLDGYTSHAAIIAPMAT
jgi:thymidylate synthase